MLDKSLEFIDLHTVSNRLDDTKYNKRNVSSFVPFPLVNRCGIQQTGRQACTSLCPILGGLLACPVCLFFFELAKVMCVVSLARPLACVACGALAGAK